MEKQVTSTPPPIPGNGGVLGTCIYIRPPVDREPAINVDMVLKDACISIETLEWPTSTVKKH